MARVLTSHLAPLCPEASQVPAWSAPFVNALLDFGELCLVARRHLVRVLLFLVRDELFFHDVISRWVHWWYWYPRAGPHILCDGRTA